MYPMAPETPDIIFTEEFTEKVNMAIEDAKDKCYERSKAPDKTAGKLLAVSFELTPWRVETENEYGSLYLIESPPFKQKMIDEILDDCDFEKVKEKAMCFGQIILQFENIKVVYPADWDYTVDKKVRKEGLSLYQKRVQEYKEEL